MADETGSATSDDHVAQGRIRDTLVKADWFDIDLYHIDHRANLRSVLVDRRLRCPVGADADRTEVWDRRFREKRERKRLPFGQQASLADFVQFHATSRPPALFNVVSGFGVDVRLRNRDLILFRSTARRLVEGLVPLVFSDRQPLHGAAVFVAGCRGGDILDWETITSGDFARRTGDDGRAARAGAEILAYRDVQLGAISGIVCSEDEAGILAEVEAAGIRELSVSRSPRHFFAKGD